LPVVQKGATVPATEPDRTTEPAPELATPARPAPATRNATSELASLHVTRAQRTAASAVTVAAPDHSEAASPNAVNPSNLLPSAELASAISTEAQPVKPTSKNTRGADAVQTSPAVPVASTASRDAVAIAAPVAALAERPMPSGTSASMPSKPSRLAPTDFASTFAAATASLLHGTSPTGVLTVKTGLDLPGSVPRTLPDTTVADIVQSIRLTAVGNGGEARIRLEPGHFGELTVSVRVDNGQVVARLQAESPVVREWLQTNQSWLRQQLAEHQLTLDRLEVAEPSAESDRSGGRGAERDRDQDQPAKRRRQPDAGDSTERFEVVA
jgi:flagellar hook-length control protein FliK